MPTTVNSRRSRGVRGQECQRRVSRRLGVPPLPRPPRRRRGASSSAPPRSARVETSDEDQDEHDDRAGDRPGPRLRPAQPDRCGVDVRCADARRPAPAATAPTRGPAAAGRTSAGRRGRCAAAPRTAGAARARRPARPPPGSPRRRQRPGPRGRSRRARPAGPARGHGRRQASARSTASAPARSAGYSLVNSTQRPSAGCGKPSRTACSHCRSTPRRAASVGSAP